MIGKKRLARWLYELGNRRLEIDDSEHIAQLRGKTSDSTWILYLDSIRDRIARGDSYGAAIAYPMTLDLAEDVRLVLQAAPTSIAVDVVLRDVAFDLLETLSDHSQLKSMLDAAGYRYSQHRDYTRGPGPYDIDLYTTMTRSHPDSEPTGETANVSFTFTDSGRLDGVRSYSMGQAPTNPIRRGGSTPTYNNVKPPRESRRAEPLWLLELTTPARNRYMAITTELKEFMQGWAAMTSDVELDFDRPLDVYGRARPFRGVQLIEIGDGFHESVQASRLQAQDLACMQRLLANRYIKWCLHGLVSDVREDIFPYNCSIMFKYPETTEELDRAKATYLRLRSKVV